MERIHNECKTIVMCYMEEVKCHQDFEGLELEMPSTCSLYDTDNLILFIVLGRSKIGLKLLGDQNCF